jgi:nicotinamidase-related amidase
MKVLLVVDVQNYFVNEHTRHIVPKIIDFIEAEKPDKIFFTRFINSKGSNFFKATGFKRCFSKKDVEMPVEFEKYINNNLFNKTTFSALKVKQLIKQLNKSDQLLICGTDTECCIYMAGMEAIDMGFDVKILKDLCASHFGIKYHKKGINLIEVNLERPSKRT